MNETQTILADPTQWVDKYADSLYSYAFLRTNDEELARDLVQETFLAALEKIDRFENRSSEKTWLTSILKNKVVDSYRKRSGMLKQAGGSDLHEEVQEDFFCAGFNNWNPSHIPKAFDLDYEPDINGKEFDGVLQQCMKKLPALWIAVFTMKHMDEEKTDLICTKLNVSSNNFWIIIHRAKLNLRSCLQKNWI